MSFDANTQLNDGTEASANRKKNKERIRWPLVAYDVLFFILVQVFFLIVYKNKPILALIDMAHQVFWSGLCVFAARHVCKVYHLIWRYGGVQSYIRLIWADMVGSAFYLLIEHFIVRIGITLDRMVAICAVNLLFCLVTRMIYRYAYKCGNSATPVGRLLRWLLKVCTGGEVACVADNSGEEKQHEEIRIAIVGTEQISVSLAQELINTSSQYLPVCFVDVDKKKAGRRILDIPVLSEDDTLFEALEGMKVQEVVFAVPSLPDERRKTLYAQYLNAGFRIKKYDYPTMESASDKRQLREFDINELLFRKPVQINNAMTGAYYRDKVVLITGGGGSIGSELCRQLAKMKPKQIVALDIYENGVYDVQQELRLAYGSKCDFRVEIASITNKPALERVFSAYKPDVVINAAAHKHVPLMEHNCIEAVVNNVFGTQNLIQLCEEYGVGRFMMVSTDKAVNPTNVMGATKRMCELMVQSAATHGKTVYSATRFGNVLGSAGSVIPLFKRQIAGGGPITLTDRRIVRYFMTIPEAARLVLESGAMAKNGELFVLDMGQPIKIEALAQAMVKLSGARNIEIIETGLRPGEKLYEELLVKTEELDKTSNKLIFIERDKPIGSEEILEKLMVLRSACDTGDDEMVRDTLHRVIPTYHTPDEVNGSAVPAINSEVTCA